MIHNDIQHQLQLLVKAAAPALIEVSDSPAELPEFVPGQKVPAFVLGSLPNGRFEVQVADKTLDMNLPRNTEPGEQLELTFISSKPRLTFALTRDLPTLPGGAEKNVTLSETARFIGALLSRTDQLAAGQAHADTPQQVSGKPERVYQPVLQQPPADTANLANALKRSVSESGLFYEAHQADWVTGQRSLASLRHEPQGQLPPSSPAPAENLKDAVAAQPGRHEPVNPQVSDLVQKQLDVLDMRQVVWHGEVWPGQQMDWQIQEDGRRNADRDEAEAASWSSRLKLDMPSLGGIQATLSLAAGQLNLSLKAAQSDSAALLGQGQQQLLDRLAAAGLTVSGMQVVHEEPGR